MDCWRLPPDAILSAFFASLRIHHNLRLLIQLSFTYCLSCPIRCYGNRRRTSAAASSPHQVSTSSRIATLVTYRRSMAERGGCFQRRLFVYLFVYQHDNFRTITRKMMKLGGCMHCTKKSHSSSNLGIRFLGPHIPKMWRFAESLRKRSTNGCGRGRRGSGPRHHIRQ